MTSLELIIPIEGPSHDTTLSANEAGVNRSSPRADGPMEDTVAIGDAYPPTTAPSEISSLKTSQRANVILQVQPKSQQIARAVTCVQLGVIVTAAILIFVSIFLPWYEEAGTEGRCSFRKIEHQAGLHPTEKFWFSKVRVTLQSLLLAVYYAFLIFHASTAITRLHTSPRSFGKRNYGLLICMIISYAIVLACFYSVRYLIRCHCGGLALVR